MPTLYSDVDGTLAFGAIPNWTLVHAIDAFLSEHDGYELVVWSHAGEDHAREWAHKCFALSSIKPEVIEKDFTRVRPGDVVIDNMKLPFGYLPRAFVTAVHEDNVQPIEPPGLPNPGWHYNTEDLQAATERMGAIV